MNCAKHFILMFMSEVIFKVRLCWDELFSAGCCCCCFFFRACWGKKKTGFACRSVDCPFQLAQKYVEMVEDDRNHLLLISNVERCLGLTANEIHKPHVEHKSILLSYYAQNCFKKEGT